MPKCTQVSLAAKKLVVRCFEQLLRNAYGCWMTSISCTAASHQTVQKCWWHRVLSCGILALTSAKQEKEEEEAKVEVEKTKKKCDVSCAVGLVVLEGLSPDAEAYLGWRHWPARRQAAHDVRGDRV